MSDIPLARTIINSSELHKAAPAPNQIDEAWLRPVLQKVLEALDYLHAQSVLHKRFSVTFLSAIDKALRVSRRDRWQSAQEWLATLTPAKDVRDRRLRNHQGRQQAVPRQKRQRPPEMPKISFLRNQAYWKHSCGLAWGASARLLAL